MKSWTSKVIIQWATIWSNKFEVQLLGQGIILRIKLKKYYHIALKIPKWFILWDNFYLKKKTYIFGDKASPKQPLTHFFPWLWFIYEFPLDRSSGIICRKSKIIHDSLHTYIIVICRETLRKTLMHVRGSPCTVASSNFFEA